MTLKKLNGLNAIISGASQGFGLAVAKHFVIEGANVMLCARNQNQLFKAQADLLALNHSTKIFALPADISKIEDVENLVIQSLEKMGTIDILIANAGIYGTKGAIDEIDWQEWSHAIDINLKGTVLQCRSVIPHFKQKKAGKIIILSGGGATKPMPYLSAYAASKAGVVRFAETLALELKSFNIDVNTVAPGALNTRLLAEVLTAGPDKVGDAFYQQSLQQQKTGGTSLEIGASLCAFLASAESNSITGKLLSAVWDPWQDLSRYKQELDQSDIYTLRRIVPEDRGKKWEHDQ